MNFFLLFSFSTIFSSIMAIFSNSWLLIWIFLEINTLSFCSIMKNYYEKSKKQSEMTMKYFIIQSISSAMLIFAMLATKITKPEIFFLLGFFSLMIKVASIPFHSWFMKMFSSISWKSGLVLMTWQKLTPIYLLIYQMTNLLFLMTFICFFFSSIYQMNKKKIKSIMAYSSIFNLGWMFISILMNMKSFFMFMLMYTISMTYTMFFMMKTSMMDMTKENMPFKMKWICFFLIINMAGIPPLLGFMMKWLVFSESVLNKMLLFCILVLVMSSINMYIYMRMAVSIFIKNSIQIQKNNKKTTRLFVSMTLALHSLPLIFLF